MIFKKEARGQESEIRIKEFNHPLISPLLRGVKRGLGAMALS